MNAQWSPMFPVFTCWELYQSVFLAEYLAAIHGDLYGGSITAMSQ